jgi:hypothetical protein
MDAVQFRDLLHRSMLSKADKQIALSRIAFGAALPDIGATVNMDRSTVSYRLRKKILPELERVMRLPQYKENPGA